VQRFYKDCKIKSKNQQKILFTEERWTKGGKKGGGKPLTTGYNNVAIGNEAGLY